MFRTLMTLRRSNGMIRTDKSDWELQESFHGYLPKLIWTLQVLNTDAGLESYRVLNKKGLLGPSSESLYVFALLQNPPLAKYGFDPVDFIIGSQSAITQYYLASSSLEFVDFAHGRLKTSEDAELVHQTVWKAIYDAGIIVSKQVDYGLVRVSEKIDLKDAHIHFVKTNIVQGNSDEFVVSIDTDVRTSSAVKSPEFEKSFFQYLIGSVVATVGVKVEVTDTYRNRWCGIMPPIVKAIHTDDEWEQRTTKLHTRSNHKQFIFEGCISGHVPLDWKIVFWEYI
eukprot:gene35093-45424_t